MTTRTAAKFDPGAPPAPGTINLAIGNPDPTAFPFDQFDLTVLAGSAIRSRAFAYGPPAGNPALAEVLRRSVLNDCGDTGATLITNGSIEAIHLVAPVLAERGNVLITEDPTFPGLAPVVAAAGLQLVGTPTDRKGVQPGRLGETIAAVRNSGGEVAGLYLMPSGSNPTGIQVPLDRRLELVSTASAQRVLIIEDDAYRCIALSGTPGPTLHSLAPDHVLHLRSLSKVFSPGFRLAAVIGPTDIVAKMQQRKPVGGTNPFGSEVLVPFLEHLDFDAHLQRLTGLYTARRDATVGALRSALPELTFTVPSAGFFIWSEVPPEIDLDGLETAAADLGVSFLKGELCTIEPTTTQHLRLAYSFEPVDQLVRGVHLLAQAVRQL